MTTTESQWEKIEEVSGEQVFCDSTALATRQHTATHSYDSWCDVSGTDLIDSVPRVGELPDTAAGIELNPLED